MKRRTDVRLFEDQLFAFAVIAALFAELVVNGHVEIAVGNFFAGELCRSKNYIAGAFIPVGISGLALLQTSRRVVGIIGTFEFLIGSAEFIGIAKLDGDDCLFLIVFFACDAA